MPRLSRQESRDLTKSRLRDAARAEIALHGVDAASIDRISEAAGFSRGAFYSNYNSKTQLLVELMDEVREREIWIWRALAEKAEDLEELLPQLEARFNDYATRRDWRILTAELRLEAQRNEGFRNAYQESRRRLSGSRLGLGHAFHAKSKRLRPEDVPKLSKLLRALSIGLLLEEGTEEDPTPPGEVITFLLRYMLGDGLPQASGEAATGDPAQD